MVLSGRTGSRERPRVGGWKCVLIDACCEARGVGKWRNV